MLLKSLTIQNHCQFKSCRVDFSRLTIFVGMNDAGKSTLLSAIGDIAKQSADLRIARTIVPHVFTGRFHASFASGGDRLSWAGAIGDEAPSGIAPFLHGFTSTRRLSTADMRRKLAKTVERLPRSLLEEVGFDRRPAYAGDGVVRLLSLAADLANPRYTGLIADDVEQHIGTEWMPLLARLLTESPKQIVASTHSPLLLNHLSDTEARNGIQLVYRDRKSIAKVVPLFSIRSLAEKLAVMGPGEAFCDTSLADLPREIEEQRAERTAVAAGGKK